MLALRTRSVTPRAEPDEEEWGEVGSELAGKGALSSEVGGRVEVGDVHLERGEDGETHEEVNELLALYQV